MTFFRTIGGGGKPCCDGPTLLKKRVLTMSEITLLAEVTAFLRQPHGQFIAGQREAGRGAPFAVIADDARRYYAMQFHPEVVHTPDGAKLIANFARHVCGLSGEWTMAEFRAAKIADIRAQVGKGRVICGLSGGVDSSVTAGLLKQQGYDVIGITLRLWEEDPACTVDNIHACCSLSSVDDAKAVASVLGIPHYTLDFRELFRRDVIDRKSVV